MANNGFNLSPEKTNLMVFTRQITSRKEFKIKINNCTINHSITTKFLGVVIHHDLLWHSHTKHLISKARRGVSAIKTLCGTTWVTPKSLLHLTHALVRSRLTYGHEASFTKTDSDWLALERIELRALKAVLGVPIYAVNDLVYQLVNWLPLRKFCKLNAVGFQLRVNFTPTNVSSVMTKDFSSNDESFRKRLAKTKPKIHKMTTPFSSYTEDIADKLEQQRPECFHSPVPPWSLKTPLIDFQYADKYIKSKDQLFITTLAKERIDKNYASHVKYYTDGSVLDSKESGCAFYAPLKNIKEKIKLNKGISVFSAELFAIYKACFHINGLQFPPNKIVIFSDSKSALQALARGGSSVRLSLQRNILELIHFILSKNIDISLMWIPSHSGIRGNDFVDSLAKSAATSGTFKNIGLSIKENMSHARQLSYQRHDSYLKIKCFEKKWHFVPGFYKHLCKLPRIHQRIINRILTVSTRYKFFPFRCPCQKSASIEHLILDDCSALPHFNSVRWLRRQHDLQCIDFLIPHPTLGFSLMRGLIDAIHSSNLIAWF
jgi:ribonuclease HI